MTTVEGTFIDGKVLPDSSLNWDNGTRVLIARAAIGEADDDQGNDPESIARWLTWYDSLEPLILTVEDERRIAEARREQRTRELANWERENLEMRKLFE